MMNIIIAKTAGFCMGVRRAVEITTAASKIIKTKVYTYGPLIHNPQIIIFFAKKGVDIETNIPSKGKGILIIRAHGIPPKEEFSLLRAGYKVINATCPHVMKLQSIIKIKSKKQYTVIIVGDKHHPEIVGLIGHSDFNTYIISNIKELISLPKFVKAILVSQTTQDLKLYVKIKNWTILNRPNYKIFKTICKSTEKRQIEIKSLAKQVDVIIVIGGKDSGNTKRLKEIAIMFKKIVLHVENELELINHKNIFLNSKIGITAGASTPKWIIKKIYKTIKNMISKNNKLKT